MGCGASGSSVHLSGQVVVGLLRTFSTLMIQMVAKRGAAREIGLECATARSVRVMITCFLFFNHPLALSTRVPARIHIPPSLASHFIFHFFFYFILGTFRMVLFNFGTENSYLGNSIIFFYEFSLPPLYYGRCTAVHTGVPPGLWCLQVWHKIWP